MTDDQPDNAGLETGHFHFESVRPGTPAYDFYLEFRFEVFCEELHRISRASCVLSSNGRHLETDQYDQHSRHFLAYHNQTGRPAASARLILPSSLGLNVTPKYIIDRPLPCPGATDENTGEISRMAIAAQFRRRRDDRNKPFQGDPGTEMSFSPERKRQHQPELVLGMYREIYLRCKDEGIAYCMAAMDNRLSRLLNTLGFPFVPIGPVNESVQPPRRVYLVGALELERSLMRGARTFDFLQGRKAGSPPSKHPPSKGNPQPYSPSSRGV